MKPGSPNLPNDSIWERFKRHKSWLMMLAFWLPVYLPQLYRSARFSLEPEVMCDDVRIVQFHFFHWMDPELFANDELGKYHTDGTPELYRGLYYLVAKLYDPFAFTKLVPYLLYGIALVGIGVAAKRLGGRAATFVAVTLCLSSPIFLNRMSGVLPRAFAYPILAWMAAALVTGRVRSFAALTILGTGFYPVLTLLGGSSLATWLFALPRRDRGSASDWSLKRRLIWLGGTAALCALLTAPFVLRMAPYGEAITPAMIADYPEAGPGGRQDSQTRPPFASLGVAWKNAAALGLTGGGTPLVPRIGRPVSSDTNLRERMLDVIYVMTALGCLSLWFARHSAMRRLATFAVAIGISYVLANAVAPKLVVPPRYTLYGVPILMILAVSTAPLGFVPRFLAQRLRRPLPVPHWSVLLSGILILALLGGKGRSDMALARYVTPADQPLYSAIAALPKSSLVAGWPIGAIETMPIVTRRTPFLTRQIHVPYHTDITLRMRHRMRRLIAAYFATDLAPLRQLRDEFGVTHLVVEPARLQRPGRYFRPFGPIISAAFAQGQAAGFVVNRLRESAAVFDGGKYFVLDLTKLPAN